MSKFLHLTVANAFIFSLLITLVYHVGVTHADYEHTCDSNSQPHSNGLCGTRLADVIANVCSTFEGFFTKYMAKRDTGRALGQKLKNILLNKKDAFSYLAKRGGHSVVCECCHNSCSTRELMQYCEPSRRLRGGSFTR